MAAAAAINRFVDATRPWLLRRVLDGTSTVAAFQKLCGVSTDFANAPTDSEPAAVIRHPLLHTYFLTAAAAGNELFYIVALPALFWLVDIDLARRVLILWWLVYYVGQSAKDLYTLPRPPSPPVTRIERHYETEYGFPSTHAMVSFTLPLYAMFALDTLGRDVHWPIGLTLCTLWCASITLSRLYVGVHSVCDLTGGMLLGVLVLCTGLLIGEPVDAFLISHPLAPVAAILVSLFCIWSYPAPQAWTNAYGDTALIIAVVAGVCCGQSVHFDRYPALEIVLSGEDLLAQAQSACGAAVFVMLRLLFGCTFLFLTRALVKKATHLIWLPFVLPKYFAYCSLHPRDASPVAVTDEANDTATTTTTRHAKADSADKTAESGAWELTPIQTKSESLNHRRVKSGGARQADATVAAGATPAPAPAPRPVTLMPPRQFRLRIDPTASPTAVTDSPTASPLEMLLSNTPTDHKLMPHPQDPKTTIVECNIDGEAVRINPLHVYLVEIPIKYVTYFAVGFNATCVVPYLFNILRI